MDISTLSRIQFGITATAHIIFPALSIGLISILLGLEIAWVRTKNESYKILYKFWSKIFAISFGMGVATGFPMAIQFGANWARFSSFSSDVIFTLLSLEVLTAFLIESIFLGVMLFGWGKISTKAHLLSTAMVFLGTHSSALWILISNSWMQTGEGVVVVNGIMKITDWSDVIFNTVFPYMISHMLVGSYVSGCLVVAGVSAVYILKKQHIEVSKVCLKFIIWPLSFLVFLVVIVGDLQGLNTLEYAPQKVAAMEGHWETHKGAPLVLFAIPDTEEEKNHFEIKIPKLSSIILTHSLNGEIKGLKSFEKDDRPSSIGGIFYAFRVMVLMGLSMWLIPIMFGILKYRKIPFYENRPFLRLLSILTPSGLIAIIAGWYVTELGRQPWIIRGLFKIKDGHSLLPANDVVISIVILVILQIIMYSTSCYYLRQTFKFGPQLLEGTTPQKS